jgi:glycosyltransferase involved in cell wall biosynthesis
VLWLIGDGSEKSKLITKAAKLNITDKVCFWGSRFGTEKDSLIAQMQVFTHPSRNEGLPTAVLEAASLGVPCLISEATNLGDEIRASGAGLVIPETNKDMIASGLEQLYQSHLQTSPELIQVISKNMVSQYFSWKNILNEFNRVYNSALS